ncbi:MAG TPA: ABC transporter permease, partial [Hyphomicrobiales bacterium]|nr:ABC transporter permease [Hyphomicrobiales bacterium]
KGTTEKVTADMSKLGTNLLFMRPGQFGPGRSSAEAKAFSIRDVEALRNQISGVVAVAPQVSKSATVVYGTESRTSTVFGSDNSFFITGGWTIVDGREFLEGELRSGRAACVIGQTVKKEIFGNIEPLGRSMRIANVSCEVIGVLEAKGRSSFGSDQDDTVIMPLRTFQRRIAGDTDIGVVHIGAAEGVDTQKVQADVERLMRERRGIRPGKEDDFSVGDMSQLVAMQTATTSVMTGLLGAVAGVSLLVGGIGIMNIMLVSVTERTREIGIRLAIGALESQVLTQFLVEAVVISLFGGLTGILIGLGLALVAAQSMSIPFVFDPTTILIAFVFSALVGVVFGFFPARRAAQLDPIEALRHE